jgi:hypothetical protein
MHASCCTAYTVSKAQEPGFNSNMTNVLVYLYPTKPFCNKALQQREGKKNNLLGWPSNKQPNKKPVAKYCCLTNTTNVSSLLITLGVSPVLWS